MKFDKNGLRLYGSKKHFSMTTVERKNKANEIQRWYFCLNHKTYKRCPSTRRCQTCNWRVHTLLFVNKQTDRDKKVIERFKSNNHDIRERIDSFASCRTNKCTYNIRGICNDEGYNRPGIPSNIYVRGSRSHSLTSADEK